jgi:hypothetical protein
MRADGFRLPRTVRALGELWLRVAVRPAGT